MRAGSVLADRAASAPLGALGVTLLVRTHGGAGGEALEVLTAVLGALAVVVAARMWCRSCFESHLLAALVAIASTAGQLLAVVVGPPGGGDVAWTPDRAAVTALGVLTLLLLVSAFLARRHDSVSTTQPYAR